MSHQPSSELLTQAINLLRGRNRAALLTWETMRPSIPEVFLGFSMLAFWLIFFALGVLVPTTDMRSALAASVTRVATTQPNCPESKPACSPTTRPRDDLTAKEIVGYFAVTLTSFTVTNLYVLGTSAAFLGCMSRRWSTPWADARFAIDLAQVRAEDQIASAAGAAAPSATTPAPAAGKQKKRKREPAEEEAVHEVRRAYMTAVLRGFLAYALIVGGYLVVVPENSLADITPGQYIRLAGLVTAICFLVGFEPNSIGRLLKLVFSPEQAELQQTEDARVRHENSKLRERLAATGISPDEAAAGAGAGGNAGANAPTPAFLNPFGAPASAQSPTHAAARDIPTRADLDGRRPDAGGGPGS